MLQAESSWTADLFLSSLEMDRLADWKELVLDRSYVNPALNPAFDWLSHFVPDGMAPNALMLTGCTALVQAWYFCEQHHKKQPRLATCVAIIGLSLSWSLGRVHSAHSRRTFNHTPLGELFKCACSLVSSVFATVILCLLLAGADLDAQWYCVQVVQLFLVLKYYSALVRGTGVCHFLVGPGEVFLGIVVSLAVGAVLGQEALVAAYHRAWDVFCSTLGGPISEVMSAPRALYLATFCMALLTALLPGLQRGPGGTRAALATILALRGASGLLRTDWVAEVPTTKWDVLCDGFFMGAISFDVVVAKMAGRGVHSALVLMAALVVLPHQQLLVICFTAFYYLAIFRSLMHHLNLPLLCTVRNVYCDGIYDLCHVGHKNLFRRAAKLGNRLFVGVVGDEDANNYKRPPVMSAAEREAEVASCKCVTKVIPDAPCFGLTEDFIRQHHIHVVAFGQEYVDRYPNPDDDPYYKVPRKMGIAVPMPRTAGLSTSDLIRRIQERGIDEKKSPT